LIFGNAVGLRVGVVKTLGLCPSHKPLRGSFVFGKKEAKKTNVGKME
jgi:hypothetical protein